MFPSLLTLGNMGLGFFALIASVNHEFTKAATAIIVAHILDILDGRVARWTKTESQFGVEFDSYADWMSFGIAPAVMVYFLALNDYKTWGLPLAFLFAVCAALRLARFNLKAHRGEKSGPYFVGLPSPVAGGTLAIFVLLFQISDKALQAQTISFLIPGIVFVLALLMVSRLRYSTFKQFHLLRPRTLRSFVITILVLTMIYVYPQNTIFFLYAGYIISGLAEYFLRVLHWSKSSHEHEAEPQEE